jgi:hypothetical protein
MTLTKGRISLFRRKEGGVADKDWLLLNSQSTVNQIANVSLLKSIRKAENPVWTQ